MSADYEFPKNLVEAQRTFYVQDQVIRRVVALHPSPRLVAEGKAMVPEKLVTALAEARAKQRAAVVTLYDFTGEFWEGMDLVGRRRAKDALEAQVQKELDAAHLKAAVDEAVDWEALGQPDGAVDGTNGALPRV
ncbi:hypothetical protein AB0J43_10085 [Nonomuraea fuscirosea]